MNIAGVIYFKTMTCFSYTDHHQVVYNLQAKHFLVKNKRNIKWDSQHNKQRNLNKLDTTVSSIHLLMQMLMLQVSTFL